MALAFLCSQLQSKFPNHFEFEAFVVDHKVRNGSDKEARAVAQLLKTFSKFLSI
jgi:tRNA(Ile)-lysidine synthase TilS/MesJ